MRTALGVLLLLGAAASAAGHSPSEDAAFIGWGGESYRPKQPGDDAQRRWVETISWSPRAFVFHNFLSAEEVNHIIGLVEKEVTRSAVVDTTTGQSKLDPIRTSYGAAIMRGQTPVVAAVEARIAEWTRLPPDHQEPLQVLRYQHGQTYKAHWDWFEDPVHTSQAGENRIATVLMYLGDVSQGGETALPLGIPIDPARQALRNVSACAAAGSMAVVPRRGDALLFWDMHVDGATVDRSSLHSSCPTTQGTKWTATKWLHNRPYGAGFDPLRQAAQCKDSSPSCPSLAAAGKCDSEAARMTGLTGLCRLSCQDCVPCSAGDLICLRRNMRSLRAARRAASSGSGGGHGAA